MVGRSLDQSLRADVNVIKSVPGARNRSETYQRAVHVDGVVRESVAIEMQRVAGRNRQNGIDGDRDVDARSGEDPIFRRGYDHVQDGLVPFIGVELQPVELSQGKRVTAIGI